MQHAEACIPGPKCCLRITLAPPSSFKKCSMLFSIASSSPFNITLRIWNTLSKVAILPIRLPLLEKSGITSVTYRTRFYVSSGCIFFIMVNPRPELSTYWDLMSRSSSMLSTLTKLRTFSLYYFKSSSADSKSTTVFNNLLLLRGCITSIRTATRLQTFYCMGINSSGMGK